MSPIRFQLPRAELSILWRYFDGVSRALAKRFASGSSPGEENLTFLLCELFDEGMAGLHLLNYPLQQARQDLAKCDGGLDLHVAFETHEHSKHVEHKYSGADLGIVFVNEHPLMGKTSRAVLLQAKRLFPARNGYRLSSEYDSFHTAQRDLLTGLEGRFSVSNSIFYLWYNPSSTEFVNEESTLLPSLEASRAARWWYPPPFDAWPPPQTYPEEESAREWRRAQPATRVSALSVVREVTASGNAPSLRSLYEARDGTELEELFRFEPLADLLVLGLVSDTVGDGSLPWLMLAHGQKISDPTSPIVGTDDDPPLPKHTLKFTLESTLKWPEHGDKR